MSWPQEALVCALKPHCCETSAAPRPALVDSHRRGKERLREREEKSGHVFQLYLLSPSPPPSLILALSQTHTQFSTFFPNCRKITAH